MTVPQKICFVCDNPIIEEQTIYHPKINLAVCNSCRGSEQETAKTTELLKGLAEGFVCGCI